MTYYDPAEEDEALESFIIMHDLPCDICRVAFSDHGDSHEYEGFRAAEYQRDLHNDAWTGDDIWEEA